MLMMSFLVSVTVMLSGSTARAEGRENARVDIEMSAEKLCSLDSGTADNDWRGVEYAFALGPVTGAGKNYGLGVPSSSGGASGVTVETFTLQMLGGIDNAILAHDATPTVRSSAPVLRASLAIEIASWVGMLVFLPDANDYKREYLDPEPDRWARDFKVEYTNNNNGFLVDYVFHPVLGATMYGYSRSAGASYFSAFLIAGVHNALWELKELPHAGGFAAQDFVTTFAASGITAIIDMLGDTILDNNPSAPLRGLAYLLKAPSAGGNFLYFVSLGIQERRKAGGNA
jgi:hypothetical protein